MQENTPNAEQVAAELTAAMIGALAMGQPSDGSARVVGRRQSVEALRRRGLIGDDHRWTALGFEVARLLLSGRTPTLDELHQKALDEAPAAAPAPAACTYGSGTPNGHSDRVHGPHGGPVATYRFTENGMTADLCAAHAARYELIEPVAGCTYPGGAPVAGPHRGPVRAVIFMETELPGQVCEAHAEQFADVLRPAAPAPARLLDPSTPTDPTVGTMTYVARRSNPVERGLVVGWPDDMAYVMVAWGEAARLTAQYAMAEAVREDPADLVRWEDRPSPEQLASVVAALTTAPACGCGSDPQGHNVDQHPSLPEQFAAVEHGRCRHDGRPIARRTDRPRAHWVHNDERGGRGCAGGRTEAEPYVIEAQPVAEQPAEVVAALAPREGENAMLSLCRVTGWAAYRAGEPRIPIQNPVIFKAVEPLRLGEGATDIYRAFLAGYDLAADQAAQAALAEPAPARPAPGPVGALHAFHHEHSGRASAEGLCGAQGARVPDALVTCPVCASLLAEGRPPAEHAHAHTLGMSCPVGDCRWPLMDGPHGVDYMPEAARALAWGAAGMGHALPPAQPYAALHPDDRAEARRRAQRLAPAEGSAVPQPGDEDYVPLERMRSPEVSGRWAGADEAQQRRLVAQAHAEALAEDEQRRAAAEHEHTVGQGCPAPECPWPARRRTPRVPRQLPPGAVDGPAGPGQL